MTGARRSMLWMLLFCFGWLVVEAMAGFLVGQYSPFQVVWTRYAVHLAFMLLVWGWRDPAGLLRTRRPVLQLGRSLLMLVMPASWVLALRHGGNGALPLAVLGLSPVIMVALAGVLTDERASRTAWIGAALASLGALLLVQGHASLMVWRFAAAVLGAASFSLYVVLTRVLRRETMRANLFYTALGVFAALSLYVPEVWRTPGAHDLLVMVLIGLLGWGVLFALDRMADAAPVTVASPLLNLMPALVLGMGPLLGARHPAHHVLLGAAIIAAVALYTAWRGAAGRTPTRPPAGSLGAA